MLVDVIRNRGQYCSADVTQCYSGTKPNAVTSLSNGASFTYDANSNITQRIEGGVVYTQVWNVDNRLVQVDCTTQPTWFYYGPDGDLVRKDNPRGSTKNRLAIWRKEGGARKRR